MKTPFNRTYWVDPKKFLAGCYPGSSIPNDTRKKLTALIDSGICHFISLMEPDEIEYVSGSVQGYESEIKSIATEKGFNATFKRMSIKDMWIPTREEMSQILDHIDQAIQEGKPVYVHCWGGHGRTGIVVGCYLARHGYASGANVLEMINDLRKSAEDAHQPSPETEQQMDFVMSWGKGG
jgi:hypothetical protein